MGAEAAKAEAAALHSEFHEELSLEDEELVASSLVEVVVVVVLSSSSTQ